MAVQWGTAQRPEAQRRRHGGKTTAATKARRAAKRRPPPTKAVGHRRPAGTKARQPRPSRPPSRGDDHGRLSGAQTATGGGAKAAAKTAQPPRPLPRGRRHEGRSHEDAGEEGGDRQGGPGQEGRRHQGGPGQEDDRPRRRPPRRQPPRRRPSRRQRRTKATATKATRQDDHGTGRPRPTRPTEEGHRPTLRGSGCAPHPTVGRDSQARGVADGHPSHQEGTRDHELHRSATEAPKHSPPRRPRTTTDRQDPGQARRPHACGSRTTRARGARQRSRRCAQILIEEIQEHRARARARRAGARRAAACVERRGR